MKNYFFSRFVLFASLIFILASTNYSSAKNEITTSSDSLPSYVIDQSQILALNQEIKSLVDLFVKPIHSKELRARALLDLMFNENKMGLKYYFFGTKSAAETVESGTGNCLSLANTYIALARYAGLNAHYLSVHIPNNWLEINEYFYLTKHTTAALKLSFSKTATVEFTGIIYGLNEHGKYISDNRGFAEYYSNIGVEYLRENNLEAAVQNLEYSIKVDKTYSNAWSNLGIVYRRLNKLHDAEIAYKIALSIDKKNLSALNNLAALYTLSGNTKFATK